MGREKLKLTKCYEILNISADSSTSEIKAQVRKLLRQFHPDVNLSNKDFYEERTKEILSAYNIILKERKEEYYRKDASHSHKTETKPKYIVIFRIANVKYGILVENVKEVFRVKDVRINQLVSENEKILGFILWRDEIVPLYKLNGNTETDLLFSSEQIIIVTNNSKIAGVLVDKVEGVMPCPAPFLRDTTSQDGKYILGTYHVGGDTVCVLNINSIL